MDEHVVTVFRNRLDPAHQDEYAAMASKMFELARSMPGFVDAKGFTAPDGERVTVVTFADRASHDAWRSHPDHLTAQRRGIEAFYLEYSIQVGTVEYTHRFVRDAVLGGWS
jgi:heme-degrading monooxygenase HmoA